jgi:GNAT superfamily N-acetyltransferase
MKIRPCNYKTDVDYICSTMEDLFKTNIEDYNPTPKLKKEFKDDILFCKGKRTTKVYVLEMDDKLIGYVQVFVKIGKKTQDKSPIISRLYINKEHRKKGLSRKLVDKVKEFAKDKGFENINLNTFLINFEVYKKFGFKVDSYWMELDI